MAAIQVFLPEIRGAQDLEVQLSISEAIITRTHKTEDEAETTLAGNSSHARCFRVMFSHFDHSCIFLYVFARIIVLDFAP